MENRQDSDSPAAAVSPGNPGHTGTMRILVLSDLAAGREVAGRPRPVTTDGLDSLVADFAPVLELRVPERLGAGTRELAVSFAPRSLADFSPDPVAAAHPVLSKLVATRELAEVRNSGGRDAASFVEAFSAIWGSDVSGSGAGSGAAPAAGGSALDSLLSKVAAPGVAASLQPLPLSELLGGLLAAGREATPSPALADHFREIDRRLSRQVEMIFAAQPFRDLESAWRGLSFLVDRAGSDPRIRIEVLPGTKDDFLDLFYKRVFREEYDLASEIPLSFVLADFALDRGQPDLELLQDGAKLAASLGTPMLFSSSPAYWGVKQASLVATLPDLVEKSRGAEYAKWNRFRAEESSLWVAIASNRVLLRDCWAGCADAVRSFRWVAGDDPVADPPAWGNGGWCLAASIARAFVHGGHAVSITGQEPPAILENLPLRTMKSAKSEPLVSPLEALYGDRRAFELAETGFAPLVGTAGRDAAWFQAAPTFHMPRRYDQAEATRSSYLTATLQYQIFAGAAAHVLQRIGAGISPGLRADELVLTVRDGLVRFLSTCEPDPNEGEVEIEIMEIPEEPALLQVAARIRPKTPLQGGAVDLVLGTTVPR